MWSGHGEAWVCTEGHVCAYPGDCTASPDRVGPEMFRHFCGAPTRPIDDYPELHAAWLLDGLEGFGALWIALKIGDCGIDVSAARLPGEQP